MRLVSTMALAAGFAFAGAATIGLAPAAAKKQEAAAGPHLSKPVLAALGAAQTAVTAGDTATATAKIAEASAAASTPEDRFYVAQLQYQVALKTGDKASQATAADTMLTSGGAPADIKPQLLQNRAAAAYNSGDYVKSEDFFAQLAQLEPNNPDTLIALAESQFRNRHVAAGLASSDKAIAVKKAAGGVVEESWYQRPLSVAYENKLVPDEIRWSDRLLTAYPTPDNWRTALTLFREGIKLDDQQQLDIYRLQRAAGALKGERDFFDYANLAYDRGLPGESKSVLDQAVAAHMIDAKAMAIKELIGLSNGKVSADKASLPAADAKARTTPDARSAVNTATAHFGYGEYSKAADLLRTVLQKPGVDADTANTRLGIALAMSQQKDEAIKAFATVTGGTRAQIAHYWSVWTAGKS